MGFLRKSRRDDGEPEAGPRDAVPALPTVQTKPVQTKPIKKFLAIHLYPDRIVEKRGFRAERVYPLKGVEARVDGAGMQRRSITLGNTAYLTITGPSIAITRVLNGPANVRIGVQFAAEITAAAKAMDAST